jgi:DNA ligase D-like protein (predicted polymerase)
MVPVMPTEKEILRINGHEVTVTNPRKVYFPASGHTKLDLVQYYLAVADGALRGAGGRPMALKRFVDGITGQAFFQKRAPENLPPFIRTATLTFPSGRTADEIVIDDAAGLAWVANLGCIDLNPHPVRAEDLEHPDELRVDLDPVPGVEWPQIRLVALAARDSLADVGLVGWPKTSGSRGIHINVRIEPRWTFPEVRRAALALARDVERRVPDLATSKWWKEERHGVFLDYNQNAKDRTVASAYSVRPLADARVSTPLTWDEVPTVEAEAFTIDTVPARFASVGDPGDGIDAAVGSLDGLLELSRRDEEKGLGDAPWPPNYAKQAGEPPRVQPSRARRPKSEYEPGRGEAGGPPPEVASARAAAVASGDPNAGLPTEWPGSRPTPTGRRRSAIPVVEISRAEHRDEALAGLERWKSRHPAVVPFLEPADILVDGMRGRSSLWYRVRVNLIHVPEGERPAQEPLESDFDPWANMDIEAWKAATAGSRARRPGSRSKQPKPADSEAEGVSPAEHAKTDSTRPAAADNEAGYEAEGSASAADPSADDDLKS